MIIRVRESPSPSPICRGSGIVPIPGSHREFRALPPTADPDRHRDRFSGDGSLAERGPAGPAVGILCALTTKEDPALPTRRAFWKSSDEDSSSTHE